MRVGHSLGYMEQGTTRLASWSPWGAEVRPPTNPDEPGTFSVLLFQSPLPRPHCQTRGSREGWSTHKGWTGEGIPGRAVEERADYVHFKVFQHGDCQGGGAGQCQVV